MSVQSTEIIDAWFRQVWSKGRFDLVASLMHPQCVGHGLEKKDGSEIEGIDEHKQFIEQLRGAFPDLGVGTDDFLCQGDRVSIQLTIRGTHMGDALGIPATHTGILISGIARFSLRDGKIETARYLLDFLNLYQQLGIVRFDPAFETRQF